MGGAAARPRLGPQGEPTVRRATEGGGLSRACRPQVGGKTVKLQVWDTAGQERFRSVTRSYYRGAAGCLLVFDITSRESFESAGHWLRDAHSLSATDISVVLVCAARASHASPPRPRAHRRPSPPPTRTLPHRARIHPPIPHAHFHTAHASNHPHTPSTPHSIHRWATSSTWGMSVQSPSTKRRDSPRYAPEEYTPKQNDTPISARSTHLRTRPGMNHETPASRPQPLAASP